MNKTIYTEEDVKKNVLQYFDGDELATDVWMKKYCMKNENGEYLELSPDDTHERMAEEFHKIEEKYYNNINYDINDISDIGKKYIKLSKNEIKNYFKDFKYIVPQGSVMASLGNPYNFSSLSNCVVIPEIYDSYGGILFADQQLVQLMKRRCGVGLDISTLRPKNTSVNNSAGTSTGAISFMERFSNTTREVAQCLHEDTMVLTEKGLIEIKYVCKGDKVWTKIGLVKVINIYKNRKKLKKLTTKYGNELICSEDHIIHTINGEKRVKELEYNDSVTIIDSQNWNTNKIRENRNDSYPKLNPILIQDYILNIDNYTDELHDVYDLSLEKEHFFFANGFYVHNSGRRGALMITIDVQHPDIQEFITIKNDLTKVTGANISVKLSDDFMNAVKNNSDFVLKFPVNSDSPTITKTINAKELWDEIVKSARNTAEPGLIFWDRQHWYSTSSVYPEYKNVSTNPCVIGDTLLLTNIGWIKIKNLKNYKDDVKIITRNNINKLYESELLDIIETKDEELFKVIFENNTHLIINKEHKFYDINYNEIGIDKMLYEYVLSGEDIVKVTDIIKLNETDTVYDITAFPNYNFFTLLNYNETIINKTINIDNDEYNYFDILNGDFVYQNIIDNDIDKDLLNDMFNKSILSVDCAEIAMGGGDSCRLIALNMFGCVDNPFTEQAKFNFDKWYEICYIGQRLNDDLVDLELNSIETILNKIKNDIEPHYIKDIEYRTWNKLYEMGKRGRRTGLGITALGDVLASLNLRYDTDESIEMIEHIMKIKCEAEFESSIDMSIQRGTFDGFNPEIEKTSEFIQMLQIELPHVYNRMMKYGRRNVSISTVAPTGCIIGDTKIKTNIGEISIKDIFKLNNINIEDLKDIRNKWFISESDIYVYNVYGQKNKINKLYWNGLTKTKKLTFSNNDVVETSLEHKFLVKINDDVAEWRTVEEIKPGDKILKLMK